MAKQDMVGDVPGKVLGMLGELRDKMQHGVITPKQLDLFLKKQNPFKAVSWIEEILAREKMLQMRFFGNFAKNFNYSPFVRTLENYGQVNIEEWRELGLEPHFLPPITMSQRNYTGWKVKPEQWFYDNVTNGNISGNPLDLGGVTVLVDIRCKPAYKKGEQMWENDLLGDIIENLREKGEIQDHQPRQSRFSISAIEIENKISPAFAKKLGLEPRQVRLERAVEFNVLSQMLTDTPRAKDGEIDTWLWFADFFESAGNRLCGGGSGSGGFALVSYDGADDRWDGRSFRLLAVI